MKKIFGMMAMVAVVFAMVGLVGCNSNKSKIVGKWQLYEKSDDGKIWEKEEDGIIIDFQKDGKVVVGNDSFGMQMNWNVDDNELTVTTKVINLTKNYTIEKISNDEMVLKAKYIKGKIGYEKYKRVK